MKRISSCKLSSPVCSSQYNHTFQEPLNYETYDLTCVEDILQIISIHFLDVSIVKKFSRILWKLSLNEKYQFFMLENGCFTSYLYMLRCHSKDDKTLLFIYTVIGT
jgi:hypothetical protein